MRLFSANLLKTPLIYGRNWPRTYLHSTLLTIVNTEKILPVPSSTELENPCSSQTLRKHDPPLPAYHWTYINVPNFIRKQEFVCQPHYRIFYSRSLVMQILVMVLTFFFLLSVIQSLSDNTIFHSMYDSLATSTICIFVSKKKRTSATQV